MIIGIDLGTTFSVGAWTDNDGKTHVANSREGGNTTPSVVMFDDGEIVIGKQAKSNAELAPENVVQFVKRNMGNKKYAFLTEDGKEYTAEELSAMILKRVKEDCETCIGQPVTDAVITVPAYFSDAQRQSTIDAGKIAGLNVRAIINEPTAAALAYGRSQSGKAQKVMVYDLGGGTFDVTIIEIKPDATIQVLATHGNRNLGGVNFDNALITYVREQFEEVTGVSLEEDDEAMQILRSRCEQAKQALSGSEKTSVVMSSQRKKAKIEVTREQFEELIMPLIEETEVDIDITLEDSGLSARDLDKVLLVGGSSRIPAVRNYVERKLNITPSAELNPDEVVAIGAAIYGHSLESQLPVPTGGTRGSGDLPNSAATCSIIQDVNSHGLGIVAVGEGNRLMNSILISRNQPIPTVARETFSTMIDNQELVELQVTEGDDDDLSYVTVIGTAEIHLPPHPAGSPLTVELSYDINGVVTGKVYDDLIQRYIGDIVINRSANLSQQEVLESAQRLENETFA